MGVNDSFFEVGGHSLLILPLRERLQNDFNISMSPVDIFRYPTIASQADFIKKSTQPEGIDPIAHLQGIPDGQQQRITSGQPQEMAGQAQKIADQAQRITPTGNENAIAIIGMALRVPGAHDLDSFWTNLVEGVESITRFTDEELLAAGVSEADINNPSYVKANGTLKDMEYFDAEFFDFTPREAEILDPQHRQLLECSWEAMEHAGYDPLNYKGKAGIFGGVGLNSYLIHNLMGRKDLIETIGPWHINLANDKDFAPTRVAYKMNLRGPAVNTSTACSTSLVGLAMGCRSLLAFDSDMILAGGCTINLPQNEGYMYHQGGILSKDGHCRPFDITANGTVDGNGVAVVVLKRLDDALRDGDTVHAVIRGFAVNNDGALKVGYTAPSIEGQAAVIREAQSMAGISPSDITHVETHGTGTDLGDAVEVAALREIFSGTAGNPPDNDNTAFNEKSVPFF
ncbi:hypothetical protein MTBBW1_90015 [Desulfamplus magnetovallimortis]|uniref:Uncharacterized protein n=1 Tax=Desulfamplus magnetovallimortis TaxID=1246637 RepID=A0A1W1HKX6_9BACT|nr:beta-ketoacyl synthase N-terminal-like domain-containing protein [Desulfamplus magnetovallimortis]SLM33113.1 hypothetical protein MTBBW1_90015 [Desulfamplus magnetovallimortis]